MINPFTLSSLQESPKEGTIVLEPLRQGFGHTIGVALRRVLLGGLTGAAVTKVKIKGATHQFTTLQGLREDVVELVLNIKQLRVQYNGEKPETIRLQATGPGEIKASALECPATVTVANPDLVLATLADKKSKLSFELTVETGTGYMTAEEQGKQKLGVIPVDANFSPVQEVQYVVQATRVGRRTDYDKLILTIKTDGTVSPSKAVLEASKILVEHFQQLVSPVAPAGEAPHSKIQGATESFMKLTIEELGLPTRIVNALHKSGYKTVEDVTSADPAELAKVKNIGEKSVANVLDKIRERGTRHST